MSIIHHMEQGVGGIRSIRQIADFVDHQDMRVGVGCQRLLEMCLFAGIGKIFDEFCGRAPIAPIINPNALLTRAQLGVRP